MALGECWKNPSHSAAPRASLAEHTLGGRHPCRLSSGDTEQLAALGAAGCADAEVTLEVGVSKAAATDVCLAAEQDGMVRVEKEATPVGEQEAPARIGNSEQGSVLGEAPREGQQSADGKRIQQPGKPLGAASAAGGHSHEDSSAGSSPCNSQRAYADVGSHAMFTPVPLVDRLPPAGCRLRLEQLPCPLPLPASCPATPVGQRRRSTPEEATPVLFDRPASAGVKSLR